MPTSVAAPAPAAAPGPSAAPGGPGGPGGPTGPVSYHPAGVGQVRSSAPQPNSYHPVLPTLPGLPVRDGHPPAHGQPHGQPHGQVGPSHEQLSGIIYRAALSYSRQDTVEVYRAGMLPVSM